jgi:DNA processing protein
VEEKDYWIAFSVFPGIGPVRFALLRSYFRSAQTAWEASTKELENTGLGPTIVSKFDQFRKTFDIAEYIARLAKEKVSVLTFLDPRYPPLLKEISDAPFVLYIKGHRPRVPIDLSRTIGIVGTRKITAYGREITERLVQELVGMGFTIVSGLAYGVDAVAHKTAIESGGNTIAVLGCGIDIIAPPSNANLYAQIANGAGAIVSEMPLGLRPNKGLFPARNRIISGLSLGVVVTEGAHDSGALITAGNAGEQGREVFAVPGPITSAMSRGPAKLLKNGATLVESAQDIVDALGINIVITRSKKEIQADTKEEQKIIDTLGTERLSFDDLVQQTGLTTANIAATLTFLEIKGKVKNFGDNIYGLI